MRLALLIAALGFLRREVALDEDYFAVHSMLL